MEEKIIAKINEEISAHNEMLKYCGARDLMVSNHAAKLAGMIEVLSMLTGKQYKRTYEGLAEK